jgi:hypothetical protein
VKLLEIQPSPRGELSDSITLNKSFIEACKAEDTLKRMTPECSSILMFDKRVGLDLRKGNRRGLETERDVGNRQDGVVAFPRYAPLAHGDLCERRVP